MTVNEDFAIYSEMLTRMRHLSLERLKRENATLRAQMALVKFYEVYHARPELVGNELVIKKGEMR